jgi:Regulator of chromosome condensation (RCC1) repeat
MRELRSLARNGRVSDIGRGNRHRGVRTRGRARRSGRRHVLEYPTAPGVGRQRGGTVRVPLGQAATAIGAGDYNGCALLADGTVKCWAIDGTYPYHSEAASRPRRGVPPSIWERVRRPEVDAPKPRGRP